MAGLNEIRAAGEEKWRVREFASHSCIGVEELLLATPHSNLGQSLCTCLVGWYPPSRGVLKQLLPGTPHLKGQGGGGSKDLEYYTEHSFIYQHTTEVEPAAQRPSSEYKVHVHVHVHVHGHVHVHVELVDLSDRSYPSSLAVG